MFDDFTNIWLFILGLGVKAPTAEWGMMLNEARKVMFTHPEMMFAPAIAIVIIVMAFNFYRMQYNLRLIQGYQWLNDVRP